MSALNLANRRAVVLGPPGSGKSNLSRALIVPAFSRVLVYDPMDEYSDAVDRYVPKRRDYPASASEFDKMARRLVIPRGRQGASPYTLLLVDEANRIAPNRKAMPEALAELNDLARHWSVALVLLARRPVQLHTDLVELAHHLFIFRMAGKNDLAYLESLHRGLGEAVAELGQYHFIHYDKGTGSWTVHDPVPEAA